MPFVNCATELGINSRVDYEGASEANLACTATVDVNIDLARFDLPMLNSGPSLG